MGDVEVLGAYFFLPFKSDGVLHFDQNGERVSANWE
jgi:hypothetical protein